MQQAIDSSFKYATRDKNPTNIDNMIYYSEDFSADTVVVNDGDTAFTFVSVPVGAQVIRVDLEIKTLPQADWGWNPTSRILTLGGGTYATTSGQLLSIIYKIKKTTL